MSSIGTGYDLSASQFSPDGRVFQVEYAQKAVENSGTAIGIRGKDGVVFAVEKLKTSKLYENDSNRRIFTVDRNVGVATAGLLADCRAVIESTREEATNYRNFYGCSPPLKYLADRVSLYMHAHTLYSSVRPFGVSVILGAYENSSPVMYTIDPSGICLGYYGCSTGKAKQAAKTELEKLKMKDMPIKELIKEAAKIIYVVHDEAKDKQFELELSWVGEATGGKHELVPKTVLAEAEAYAKEQMESDESDDEETETAAPH